MHSANKIGKPLTNITSFFGITLRKLEHLTYAKRAMNEGRKMLMESGNFGSNAIDNTQILTSRKHQRGSLLTLMHMFTSRLFLLVVQLSGWLLKARWKPDTPITYLNQIIPHPKGMLVYHLYPNHKLRTKCILS